MSCHGNCSHSEAEISSPNATITVTAGGDDNQTFTVDINPVSAVALMVTSPSAMLVLGNALMNNPSFLALLDARIQNNP